MYLLPGDLRQNATASCRFIQTPIASRHQPLCGSVCAIELSLEKLQDAWCKFFNKGSFTYYVITEGEGGFQMITFDYEGEGGFGQ